jgi:dTDP-4-dehydrorhamnose 3,5-epimerase
MIIENTTIKDLKIIHPDVFEDGRGYFYESYNQRTFHQNGIIDHFVQDNQSLSQSRVLRGMHFQNPPYAQGKLVRVIKGSILDVALDLRKKSPTYGKHFAIELNEKNKLMLWLPIGFAHGFVTLENETIFSYKCSSFYNKLSEVCILWDDKTLNINWGISNPILSQKDREGVLFDKFVSPFE